MFRAKRGPSLNAVILGYVGWAAGNFAPSYVLVSTLHFRTTFCDLSPFLQGETPTLSGTTWSDTLLVQSCLAPIANAQKGSTG